MDLEPFAASGLDAGADEARQSVVAAADARRKVARDRHRSGVIGMTAGVEDLGVVEVQGEGM
jgi:hypothetical protein